jgi:hypothetical protein
MNIFTSRLFYVVAGFMLGVVVSVLFGLPSAFPILTTNTPVSASSTNPLPPNSGDVAVADQPAGNTVLVDSVTVPPPGVWVAVEEVNEDGTLGNVLGATLVGHPATNVSVALLRSTLPNQTYAVVLYRNDGDGQFNITNESLYVDFTTGQQVEELFKTTSN